MLWVSMISMVMFFAGLTSAYVISMRRDDWVSFELPQAFYVSTFLIVLSSITLQFSQYFIKTNKRQLSLVLVVLTFLLGVGFIWQQYVGFQSIEKYRIIFYRTRKHGINIVYNWDHVFACFTPFSRGYCTVGCYL